MKTTPLLLLAPIALLAACTAASRPTPVAPPPAESAAVTPMATAPATAPAETQPGVPSAEPRAPVTILVSIDGFRADYLHRGNTPHLDALAAEGATGPMHPSFPSKTFPNHYALVTGDRPDRNGIVGNVMTDPARPGVTFTLGDRPIATDPFWWNEAEPIWVTAERAGIRTGTVFWPGSEVAIRGVRPSDWLAYDKAIDGKARERTVIDWLRRPASLRPAFLTLYFDTVDNAGHHFGPDAPETAKVVADVDARIGDLVADLKALHQPANLIIVSDHGMAAVSADRAVDLDTLLPRSAYRLVADGPYAGIDPLPGQEKRVAAALLAPHPHLRCTPKADVPARLHYGHNPRVPAIICLTDAGWQIVQGDRRQTEGGAHGYDPLAPEMTALFIAVGPDIRPHVRLAPFDNVDVYPLLAHLVGVIPLPSDGNPTGLDQYVTLP